MVPMFGQFLTFGIKLCSDLTAGVLSMCVREGKSTVKVCFSNDPKLCLIVCVAIVRMR